MKNPLLAVMFAILLAWMSAGTMGCGSGDPQDTASSDDALADPAGEPDDAIDANPYWKAVVATEAWPAEAWNQSTILTSLDSDFQKNLSGAHWNDATRTLWVCINGPGKFWALQENGNGGFAIRGKWSIPGDIESITQVDLNEPSVYVISEGEDRIRKYDVSVNGQATLLREWNIAPYVPAYAGGAGSEGIAFVPDDWLRLNGFVDGNGNPYVSRNGMGGLMFVAHQNGGGIYVFDLDPDSNDVAFVASYKTLRPESSGLEFDRTAGYLYIWHNTGSNFLEVSDLSSYVGAGNARYFTTTKEFFGPKGGNLEGIAIVPAASGERWAFMTDDDNQNGAALMWFAHFDPRLPEHDVSATRVTSRVSSATDDAEEFADGRMSTGSTDLELVTDSSVQTVGIRFNAIAVPRSSLIEKATIQFATDETSAGATSLTIAGEANANAATYSTAARNISARQKTATTVSWVPPSWDIVDEAGEDQLTPDLTAIVQEIVDRPDWNAGNPMAFVITGSGKRVARAFEASPSLAPQLSIEYADAGGEPMEQIIAIDARISSKANDAEESAAGAVSLGSTDLELVTDASAQTVGMRFAVVNIPPGAQIQSAYLQFAVDETSSAATSLVVQGEASANPAAFATTSRNLSGRGKTTARVAWTPPAWNAEGEAGINQRTPDLAAIVQEIVGMNGWQAGNPMAFIATGSGKRIAEAFDGSALKAPLLHVEYRN